MFFFAIPRLDKSMFFNESRQVSSWIMLKVNALKNKALSEHSRYILHVDISENRFWISKEAVVADAVSSSENNPEDVPEEKAGAPSKQDEYKLPNGFHLLDVEFSDNRIKASGTVDLLFYPEGYSDRAIIHLENPDGQRFSYIIESFLPQVQLRQEYVEF